jgi:hypothetical protein
VCGYQRMEIEDIIAIAKSYQVTAEDINKLQERLAKFEEEHKPLPFEYNLVYNI